MSQQYLTEIDSADIPVHLVCYFLYGDADDLTEEETKQADQWLQGIKEANDVTGQVTFSWGIDEHFSHNPDVIKQGCNVLGAKLYAIK